MNLTNVNYYDLLNENTIDPILFIKNEQIINCNKATLNILGIKEKENLFNIKLKEISPLNQPDGVLSSEKAKDIYITCSKKGFCRFDWLHTDFNKKEFYVEVTLKKSVIDNEELFIAEWRDISKRKEIETDIKNKNNELKEKHVQIKKLNNILKDITNSDSIEALMLLEEYKRALDESSIVSKTNTKGIITYVNNNFCEISGYTKEELLGKNHNIVKSNETPSIIFKNMWKTIENKKIFKSVIANKRKDGTIYYVNSTIIPILDSDNEIVEYIGIRSDITSIYEKDKIITKQFTDDMTGLPNRQKLVDDSKNLPFPKLAMININYFRDINDVYGIEVGDFILKKFSQKLSEYFKSNINIYRISGDVFGLLAFNDFSIDSLKNLCLGFLKNIKTNPIKYEEQTLNLSFSIGISSGKEWLLVEAEMALLQAKEDNKELVINLEENNKDTLKKKVELTNTIKEALKNNNLLIYGQKIINNNTNEIKYEVLMRLKTSDKILSPYYFLKHAKKARLYHEMTREIIKKACEYFKNKENVFSINLTMQDITNEDTVQYLIDTLIETKTNKRIILEIVETEQINQFEKVSLFIKKMKNIGAKIAIDDFGTGYSNFEYIIKLNIDILKIDGSLIKNIHKDKNVFITVSTIVNFAKQLGLEVVAEFVNSKEVLETIKLLNIEYSQGYFLHEPEELV